jgi:hypothetical protein
MKKKLVFGIFVLSVLFLSANAVVAQPDGSWGAGVVKDAVYTWTISDLDANGSTDYTWAFAENMSLSEGDDIVLTVGDVSAGIVDPGTTNVINYNLSLTVGGTAVTGDGASALFWLICPVYVMNPLGTDYMSGFIGMERIFFNELIGGQYDWNFAADGGDAGLDQIGYNADPTHTVTCWITAQDAVTWGSTEMYAFDVEYNASSGIAMTADYPSSVPQTALTEATDFWPVGTLIPFHANSTNNGVTEGLDAFSIEYVSGDLSAATGSDPAPAPGFELPIALAFMATAAILLRRRR